MGPFSTLKSFSLNYAQSRRCNAQPLLAEPQVQLLSPRQALGDLSHVTSSISTAAPFQAIGCSASSVHAGKKNTLYLVKSQVIG